MKVFITVDENGGLLFNQRRQSKDSKLRAHILHICGINKLWLHPFSASQFTKPLPNNIIINPFCLEKAQDNDYCFIENLPLTHYLPKINTVFLCKWNRSYPADIYLDINLSANFVLQKITEIKGTSHPQITIEEWQK